MGLYGDPLREDRGSILFFFEKSQLDNQRSCSADKVRIIAAAQRDSEEMEKYFTISLKIVYNL